MARIPDTELERLKREMSMARPIEAQDLELFSQGKNLACRCTWHKGVVLPHKLARHAMKHWTDMA